MIVDALADMGAGAWFRLGDRDFATCIYRTERIKEGAPLSEVTAEIASSLGIRSRILPMTDGRVATMIEAADGRTLEFQEYFVKERAAPEVKAIRFEGIDVAQPAPGVLESIEGADRVVICPSNPLVSVGPILALPGVRDALAAHPDVVAVSPIVEGAALKGPADRMLAAGGIPVGPGGVAGLYRDFLNWFVLDSRDAADAGDVERLGIESLVCDTIMGDGERSEELARSVLDWRAA
jgi:LPPG:FO 2-phospho-L-lactate transferase